MTEVTDPGKTAVIVVDMLNCYEHEDAEALCESVDRGLPAICEIVSYAQRSDRPLVYVNDNYGDWARARSSPKVALGGHNPT